MKKSNMFKTMAVVVLSACVLSVGLTGCGKSKNDEITETLKETYSMTDEDAQEVADFITGEYSDVSDNDADNESAENESAVSENVSGEAATQPKTYDKSADWDTLSSTLQGIQIDETVYTPDVPVSDVMKLVDDSEVEYTHDYNADKLVAANGSERISVAKNGESWFHISVWNPTEDTCHLSECIVIGINVEQAAKPFCRFIDGRTYDEILALSYDDVKAMTNIFEEPYYHVNEDASTDGTTISVTYINEYCQCICVNDTNFADKVVEVSVCYNFTINTETNMVSDINVNMLGYSEEK